MSRQVDTIILGQGIAGSMLSWFLLKRGQKVMVIDDGCQAAASKVAIGTCNPITGVRFVKTWRVETLFPFAQQTYAEIEQALQTRFCYSISIYRAFPNEKLRSKWLRKADLPDYRPFIESVHTEPVFAEYCHDPLGGILLRGGFRVDTKSFLAAYRAFLRARDALLETRISSDEIRFGAGEVTIGPLRGKRLILCTGADEALAPIFPPLPFSISKGEVMRISAGGLELDTVFNKGIFILPEGNGVFAVGASHDHEHIDTVPSADGRAYLDAGVRKAIRSEFKVISQEAGLRPTTRDRRPFIGLHPDNASLAIFNGFGGKGFSVVPYFAEQFSRHLLDGDPVDADVCIDRWANGTSAADEQPIE